MLETGFSLPRSQVLVWLFVLIVVRTALKFRFSVPLFSEPFACAALTNSGLACGCQMDVYGDHALCCHNGTLLLFRHNSVRDILGHAARAAWSQCSGD